MELEEACRILGVRKGDSDIAVKSKYRKLMFLYHPDASGVEDGNLLRMAQRVNEAYTLLRKENLQMPDAEDDDGWQADENPNAYAERGIYVDYSFFDAQTPIREVTRGRYLWDPYIEEFPMMMKSIHDVCQDLLEQADRKHHIYSLYDHPDSEGRQTTAVRLFHLMMQEYINPLSCIEKLGIPCEDGKGWEFDGAVAIEGNLPTPNIGDPVHAIAHDTKIIICDANGEILGTLSFDDDSLYYVLTPLVCSDKVKVTCTAGENHILQGGRRRKQDVVITVSNISDKTNQMPIHRVEILEIMDEYSLTLK